MRIFFISFLKFILLIGLFNSCRSSDASWRASILDYTDYEVIPPRIDEVGVSQDAVLYYSNVIENHKLSRQQKLAVWSFRNNTDFEVRYFEDLYLLDIARDENSSWLLLRSSNRWMIARPSSDLSLDTFLVSQTPYSYISFNNDTIYLFSQDKIDVFVASDGRLEAANELRLPSSLGMSVNGLNRNSILLSRRDEEGRVRYHAYGLTKDSLYHWKDLGNVKIIAGSFRGTFYIKEDTLFYQGMESRDLPVHVITTDSQVINSSILSGLELSESEYLLHVATGGSIPRRHYYYIFSGEQMLRFSDEMLGSQTLRRPLLQDENTVITNSHRRKYSFIRRNLN